MYCAGKLTNVLTDADAIDKTSSGFKSMCRVAILCNRAVFLPNQSDISIKLRTITGDASETGVLKFMEMVHGNTAGYRHKYPKVRCHNIVKKSIFICNRNLLRSFARSHSIPRINTKYPYINREKQVFW